MALRIEIVADVVAYKQNSYGEFADRENPGQMRPGGTSRRVYVVQAADAGVEILKCSDTPDGAALFQSVQGLGRYKLSFQGDKLLAAAPVKA